jgi:hypothetical protein
VDLTEADLRAGKEARGRQGRYNHNKVLKEALDRRGKRLKSLLRRVREKRGANRPSKSQRRVEWRAWPDQITLASLTTCVNGQQQDDSTEIVLWIYVKEKGLIKYKEWNLL